jgi:hypothetical protein
MKTSIIYNNIYFYRLVMNLLYSARYNHRFKDIFSRISDSDSSVLDLCFGDTYIAEKCREQGKKWQGYDLNESFVRNAVKKGFNAEVKDLLKLKEFPRTDVCIMSGSLYHFNDALDDVLSKMLNCAPKVIISEPIKNISSQKGLPGKFAQIFTDAGKGSEAFRFNEKSFIEMLDKYSGKYNFSYTVISVDRDILVEIKND